MLKTSAFLIVLCTLPLQPAWSQGAETQTYHLSVTIPETVTLSAPTASLQPSQQKKQPQLTQTQQLVRNHQVVTVTSIVVR